MKKIKRLFVKIMIFVMVMAVLVSPMSEHLPIIGEWMKVSAAEIALETVNVHITSSSDSRVTDALNRISQQAGASSSIRNNSSDTIKDLISYFLNTSKYKVFGGQGIPYEYSNAAGGTTYFTDGKYKVKVSAAGCLAYAKWVRGIIYKDGVGNEIKYTKGELTVDKLKDMLVTNGQAGETIHVNTNIHSIVFISCDDTGFYYIDWSGSSSGVDAYARFRYITYDNFVKYVKSKGSASTVGLANRNTATNSVSGGDSGTTGTVTITNTTSKNTITDTNAIIWAQVDKAKSYAVTKIGVRVRVDGGTYANGWSKYDNTSKTYTDSTYMYMYYDMNKELNLKLTPSTTYYYQFYAVVNGQEYWGTEGKFTTTNSVTITNTTSKNTITDTNAIIWAQVDKPKSYSVTKIGIRVRVDGGTYANGWSKYDNTSKNYTDSTYMYMYYDMNKELNLKLTHGTTYYYQFYAVVNGQEYWGPESKFTTTGSSHSYGSWTTTKEATCTESGTKTRTCSCGAKETQTIAALGHNWSTTWSKDGSNHWRICSRCNSVGDKTAHNWNSGTVTKQPTCAAKGEKTYTCPVCRATKTESVAALGHSWSTVWSKDSSNHWRLCTLCNSTDDKAGHIWNSGTVTKLPTCTAKGEKTYTCSVCNATKTESVAALGHNWSTAWSKDSSSHWHICTLCNSIGDKTAHSFTTKVVAPTSSTQGYTLYTCSVCSYSYKDNYTSSVTTCNHKNTKEVTTNATCGKDGKTETVCKDCGKTISTVTIPATGKHIWDNGRETKKATCTATGTITYTCTVCGKTNIETVVATGHSFGAWAVTKEATYTQAGQRSRTCKLCGKTETETLPKLTETSNGETVTTVTVPEPEIIDNGSDGSNNPPTNNNDYPGITVGSSDSDIINDDASNGNANTDNSAFSSEGSNSGANTSVTDDGFHVDENNNGGNEGANIDSNGSDSSDSDPADTNNSDTNSDALIVDEVTKIELSSVDGNIPNGSRLEVVLDSENRSDTYIVFDITLVDANGNHIQPSGNVTVKIPIPADWSVNELYIYREESDGTYTDMNVTYDKDYAMFTTEHFSTYIFTSEKHEASIKDDLFESFDIILDDSENNSNIFTFAIIALIILAVAALTVVVVFLLKKNR